MTHNISETDFLQRLSRILFECGHIKKGEKILLTTLFGQDLALDSLETIEIIKNLEEEYHIDLSMTDPKTIHSVNDFYNIFTAEKRMQNLYHRGKSRPVLSAINRKMKKHVMSPCSRQYDA